MVTKQERTSKQGRGTVGAIGREHKDCLSYCIRNPRNSVSWLPIQRRVILVK